MHACMHTYIYTHTHIHAYIHSYRQTDGHTYTHNYLCLSVCKTWARAAYFTCTWKFTCTWIVLLNLLHLTYLTHCIEYCYTYAELFVFTNCSYTCLPECLAAELSSRRASAEQKQVHASHSCCISTAVNVVCIILFALFVCFKCILISNIIRIYWHLYLLTAATLLPKWLAGE